MKKSLAFIAAAAATVAMSPAVFAGSAHNIVVEYNKEGGIATVNPTSAKKNRNIDLTIIANENYECDKVESDQIKGLTCDPKPFEMVDEDVTIRVTFKAVEPKTEEETEEETEDEPVVEEDEEVAEETEAPLTGAASFAVFYIAAAALILGGAFVAAKAKREA